jgi:DNA-binding MarR family transcriptional regulator
LLGFKSSRDKNEVANGFSNGDVAKLFFDTFSKRIASVEETLRHMSSEFEKLKLSVERNQISDLVLLERLQKSEAIVKETLGALKIAVEEVIAVEAGQSRPRAAVGQNLERSKDDEATRIESVIASHVISPTGELGSLPSITTPTELQVLTLLAEQGPKSAPEIGRVVGRSREHTARLMKKLYEEGYIRRDQSRIPFRYAVVDRLKQTVKKLEVKDEEKEPVSVRQT